MAKRDTFANRFNTADQAREQIMDRKRLCAALSKPWHLPLETQRDSETLPQNYMSLGARGLTNMAGRFLIAGYPLAQPWFRLQPAAEIRFDPRVDPKLIADMENDLYYQQMMAQAILESAGRSRKQNSGRRQINFFTKKRVIIEMVIGIGDVLQCLDNDYRLKYFRFDHYVTKRNTSGEVLYHITHEQIDPLTLSDDEIEQAGLVKSELQDQHVADRILDLYTNIQWQPQTKKWLIEQEAGDKPIGEPSEEPVAKYWSTTYELVDGEDYGRSFLESNLGDLNSYNTLREKMLDFAALHSKQTPAIDFDSNVEETDLAKKSGVAIRANVKGGKVQDVGWLGPDNVQNYEVVRATSSEIRSDLAQTLLIESELQPHKERVTATQIRRIAEELQGATGGLWAPMADEDLAPLIDRTLWQMKRDNIIPTWDEEDVKPEPLTGLAALTRDVEADKILGALERLAPLGEALTSRINFDVVIDIVMRTEGIAHLGLTKSKEQMAQEMQAQMAQAAAAKGIDVAGNIAEEQAKQQSAA